LPSRLFYLIRALRRRATANAICIALEWGGPDAELMADVLRLTPERRRRFLRQVREAKIASPDCDLAELHLELEHLAHDPESMFRGGRSDALIDGHDRTALFVVRTALPASRNGYALRTQALAESASALGWTIHVAVLDAPEGTRWAERSVTYHGLGAPHERGPSAYADARARGLTSLIVQIRPVILHAASNALCAAAAAKAAAACRLPWAYELRGLWNLTRESVEPRFLNGPGARAQQALEHEAVKTANAVFANGRELSRWASQISTTPVTNIPNGVSLSGPPAEEDVARQHTLWSPRGVPIIGYAGALVAYEGLEHLIDASRRLTCRGKHHVLVIAGDGPQRSALDQAARGLDNVIFSGALDDRAAKLATHAFDICCVPRLDLPVTRLVAPLKPLDAIAAGKALVVSDLPALADLIEAGAAYPVRPGAPDALAKALSLLLAVDARKPLAAAATRYARNVTWRKSAQSLIDRWETTIKEFEHR